MCKAAAGDCDLIDVSLIPKADGCRHVPEVSCICKMQSGTSSEAWNPNIERKADKRGKLIVVQ